VQHLIIASLTLSSVHNVLIVWHSSPALCLSVCTTRYMSDGWIRIHRRQTMAS